MNQNFNLKQCCKYTYNIFPKLTIKKVLELNPWLFNNSYNFFAFYDDQTIIPENVLTIEKNWKTDNYVLFSGTTNNLNDYINQLDWDSFATWYVFLYPMELKDDKTVIIGRERSLEKSKGGNYEHYFGLSDDWKFMHYISPDLFITKQAKGIMIGALNDLNLLCIESQISK